MVKCSKIDLRFFVVVEKFFGFFGVIFMPH